jgi:hypothetical protein
VKGMEVAVFGQSVPEEGVGQVGERRLQCVVDTRKKDCIKCPHLLQTSL